MSAVKLRPLRRLPTRRPGSEPVVEHEDYEVSTAILNTIEQNGSDAVLLGWRGRSRRRDFVFGSNVDEIIAKAPCDVFVERIGPGIDRVERILLPTAGGPHAELAAELAGAIARANDSEIDVVHVVDPDATDSERSAAMEKIEATTVVLGDYERNNSRLLEGDDVVDTIVEHAGEYDLTIIGATREGLFQQVLFGAIPEEVGKRAPTTVIMAKRYLGLGSRVKRWLQGYQRN